MILCPVCGGGLGSGADGYAGPGSCPCGRLFAAGAMLDRLFYRVRQDVYLHVDVGLLGRVGSWASEDLALDPGTDAAEQGVRELVADSLLDQMVREVLGS